MTLAYPLQWPQDKLRTASPQISRFNTTFTMVRENLAKELYKLGAVNCVLSSNVELRLDGLPYASRRKPEDAGVAIYFILNGRQMCFACDKWTTVKDNMHAIAKTIAAIRGIARWGSEDMLESAFAGFEALPPPSQDSCHEILGVATGSSFVELRAAYLKLAKQLHPDCGGSNEAMYRLNAAYREALDELPN